MWTARDVWGTLDTRSPALACQMTSWSASNLRTPSSTFSSPLTAPHWRPAGRFPTLQASSSKTGTVVRGLFGFPSESPAVCVFLLWQGVGVQRLAAQGRCDHCNWRSSRRLHMGQCAAGAEVRPDVVSSQGFIFVPVGCDQWQVNMSLIETSEWRYRD